MGMSQSAHRKAPATCRAFRLQTDCNGDIDRMARAGDNIHIPLRETDALRALLRVKPTADMPRPGAQATKAKRKTKKKQ
jgi:hypothetical protein